MIATLTVTCPECGADDTTTIEVEEPGIAYFTTECVHCTNPYAIKVFTSASATPYRLIKAE